MTKSIEPNSLAVRSAACCSWAGSLTSTPPNASTLEPGRAVSMSRAIFSVFSTLRPRMAAFAPRWTRARTCAEHIEPAPPVQKTTLLAAKRLADGPEKCVR